MADDAACRYEDSDVEAPAGAGDDDDEEEEDEEDEDAEDDGDEPAEGMRRSRLPPTDTWSVLDLWPSPRLFHFKN